MPASWPASIKTFTTRTDNTDTIFAGHMNDVQAEIVAIETSLGVGVKGAYADVATRLDALGAVAGDSDQIVIANQLFG